MTIVVKKKIHFVILIVLLPLRVYSQDLPIYNHYFANPFFYNPSYSNASTRSEIGFLYRQQFNGIADGPRFYNLTFTAPINNKMGFGVNLSKNQRGVINTTSIQLSVSYKAQFTEDTYLSFGLSAGSGKNDLDKDQVDPTDPLVAQLQSSSFYLDGQAGFNLHHKNLNIGLSLPQLFDRGITNSNSFQKVAFSPLSLAVASIRYKIMFNEDFSFEPLFLSKISTTSNQWEGYGIAYYKDFLWLGGMYRQNYGTAGLLGFNINQAFEVGYSYEFSVNQTSDLIFNTHELRLSLRFGKDRGNSKVKNRNQSIPYPSYRKTNHYRKTHHNY
jgi:type IX secretion system PorP/SprF family membrane protein